jgi:hypothetical protein
LTLGRDKRKPRNAQLTSAVRAQLFQSANFIQPLSDSAAPARVFRAPSGAAVEVQWVVVSSQENAMFAARNWTPGLVTAGLGLLLFSSWMLQITQQPKPLAPVRTVPRKIVHGVPAARPQARDKRSENGHEPAPVAWMLHDFPLRDAAG